MKNDSTQKSFFQLSEDDQKKIIDKSADKANEMQRESTPSKGWDLESLIAQEIGYISGIFMSQGDTKAKDIIMPTEELKEVADRINLYCLKEIAKARQEVMMTELVHCEEAIERARQEITDWSLKQQEKAYRIGIDIGRQEERREIVDKLKDACSDYCFIGDGSSDSSEETMRMSEHLIKHMGLEYLEEE